MTHKTFWDDPYQTQLSTVVTRVEGDWLVPAATILYAFAGGQERDHGTINGHQVLEARKEGRDILYQLTPNHGLQPGDAIAMTLDWKRRYRLMRLHFAAELILELTYRRLPGIEKIGAHIAEDKSRIDFVWPEALTPLLPDLQAAAAALIDADHPIISAFSDEAAERRCWEIDGFARVACGGTHLRRTGEVGPITLKRKNVGRGKERIEIALGSPA